MYRGRFLQIKGGKNMLSIIKKTLKWVGIVLGVIIILLVIAAVALPYFLPLDKIKDIAAQKASEAIHRQVKIGKVSFNIFKGIELKDLSVSNRPGFSKEPFLSAGSIELKYDLWKLLRGSVAIDKVVIVRPEILVEMRADGTSNYGDLVGVKKPASAKAPAGKPAPAKKKEAVSIMVSKFAIVNGKLTLNQAGKVSQLKDLNVNISGISLVTKKPIHIYVSVLGVYEGKPVPISISGDVMLDMNKSSAKISGLEISAAGEKLLLKADIANFDKAPSINLKVSSPKIDVDKFLAIVSGTGSKKAKAAPPPYGAQTANINKSLKSIPSNIKLAADIDLNNILYKEMKLDSVKGSVKLVNKIADINISGIKAYKGEVTSRIKADLNVSGISYSVSDLVGKGFDATPASNDVIESFLTKLPDYKDLKDKLHGDLGFRLSSLTGRGVETPDILANVKANGSFILANGKLSKLKSLSAVGEKIGLKMLQEDIALKEFKANFSVANKIAAISNMSLNNGDAGDIKLSFNGSANIVSLEFVKGNTLSLKLNPRTTKLSSEYDAFKDKNGWYSLDFEMIGSLKRPIPIPRFEKAAQQIIDVKKKEAEEAAQKEIDKAKKEAEQKAKEELEQKAKEMLKF
jgi:uncharacterized protein involved in outer membrane biogenesis